MVQDLQHTSSRNKLATQDIAGRALGIGLALAICAASVWLTYTFIIPLLVFFGLCGSIFVQVRRLQGIPAAADLPPLLSALCYTMLLGTFFYYATNPAYQIWLIPYLGMFSVLVVAVKIAAAFVTLAPAAGAVVNGCTRVVCILYPLFILSILFGVLKA